MEFKTNNKPIYLQIADKICDDITEGHFVEGDRIPSVREYAALLQVNANTVMRAFDFLSEQQIIFNRRGVGYFIADDARSRVVSIRYREFIDNEIDYLFDRLDKIGIPPEELAELYRNYITKNIQKDKL